MASEADRRQKLMGSMQDIPAPGTVAVRPLKTVGNALGNVAAKINGKKPKKQKKYTNPFSRMLSDMSKAMGRK